MEKFTIRDIEHMTGIKAHTLRIWEQRYNLFTPKRKESKHRYYDNDDLKALLQIAFLYHNGWKISRIAQLTSETITAAVTATEINSENYKVAVLKLLDAALHFNEKAFVEILNELIESVGLEACIKQVCYPFLQRVGLLWMTNNIIPAQEHFSSYLIQHKIIAETDKLPDVLPDKESIILFTPDGEYHELPLLFINYLLKKNNWRTIYLGSDVKMQHLRKFESDPNITYLFLHVITNFSGWEIDEYLEQLCATFPDKKIVGSGAGVQKGQRSFLNLMPLKTDDAIYGFITRKAIPSVIHNS
jgi:MerR family transcriptional regulator, light-induced transcriptional regulator